MQLSPRAAHRRVLGTWLCVLIFLVTCLPIDTGDDAFVGILVPAAVVVLVLLAADAYNRTSFKNRLPVSRLSSGLRWTAELATRFFKALAARLIEIEFVPGRILTSRQALNERFDRCQHKTSVNLPVLSPTSAQLERAGTLEDRPSEPPLVLSPQLWEGNAAFYPLPPDSQEECESVQGYTLDVIEEHQEEEDVSLMNHSALPDASPDVDIHHPTIPLSRYPLESSTAAPKHAIEDESLSFGYLFQNDDEDEEEYDEEELLAPIKGCSFPATPLQVNQPRCVQSEPASQVPSDPDSVRVDEKSEEDSSALDPRLVNQMVLESRIRLLKLAGRFPMLVHSEQQSWGLLPPSLGNPTM